MLTLICICKNQVTKKRSQIRTKIFKPPFTVIVLNQLIEAIKTRGLNTKTTTIKIKKK